MLSNAKQCQAMLILSNASAKQCSMLMLSNSNANAKQC